VVRAPFSLPAVCDFAASPVLAALLAVLLDRGGVSVFSCFAKKRSSFVQEKKRPKIT
jgi:hypothetical protein